MKFIHFFRTLEFKLKRRGVIFFFCWKEVRRVGLEKGYPQSSADFREKGAGRRESRMPPDTGCSVQNIYDKVSPFLILTGCNTVQCLIVIHELILTGKGELVGARYAEVST